MKNKTIRSITLCWLALGSLLGAGANMRTPPAQTNAVTFAVIGDYGLAGQAEADVAKLVKSWQPDFIVTVGDNNYPDGAAYSLDQNIGQYYHDYIFKYAGKYGAGADTRRFFPALGNHDWHEGSANPYLRYFDLPGNERFYEFAYGPARFFILDSMKEEEAGNTADSAQAKWLQGALAASTAKFNVVVTHYPPYSSGEHGSVPFMQWPFKAWGADIVLAGHNHIYERLEVDGLPYIVNGLGGDETGKFRAEILPQSRARYNGDFGALRVEANDAYMKFQFITRRGSVADEYVLGEGLPLVASITSAAPKLTNARTMDFQVAFSEAVSGVDISDFAASASGLSEARVAAVNGLGQNYAVTIHASGAGELRLELRDDDSIVNAAGMPLGGSGAGNGSRASETYRVDTIPPTALAIARVNPSPTNAEAVNFAVTLSEPVTGVDVSDFGVSTSNAGAGARVVNVSGSGAEYLVTINPGSGNQTLRLDLAGNGSVMDAAGNALGGSFTSTDAYEVDRAAPVVFSILRADTNPSGAQMVNYAATFSEPVTGVDASDFAVSATGISGAYIAGVTGGGSVYVISAYTGNGSGELRLDLVNNLSIMDALGNALAFGGAGETYTMTRTAPAVVAITRAAPEWSAAASADFIVSFNEAVTGVDGADFGVSATGISGAYVSGVNGGGQSYTVTVNTGSGDGTLRLDVLDDDSIVNAAGMPLGMAGLGNGNFTAGESYLISKPQPAVSGELPAPAITNPARGALINTLTPTLSWAKVWGAQRYEVVVARDAAATQIILTQSASGAECVVTLPGDGVYYWRVRASELNMPPGKFSGAEAFTVDTTPPPVPNLLSPADNARLYARFRFEWEDSGATRYQIQIDNNPDFSSPEWDSWRREAYYQIASMPRNATYYWRVRAKDMANNWSAWSATRKMSVP